MLLNGFFPATPIFFSLEKDDRDVIWAVLSLLHWIFVYKCLVRYTAAAAAFYGTGCFTSWQQQQPQQQR